MTTGMADDEPIWARPEAFPAAGGGFGWVDRKGRRQACESLEDLAAAIVDDAGARVDMVWTPGSPHLVMPEEIAELHPALKQARIRWAEWEMREGKRQMTIFGAFLGGLMIFSLVTSRPLMAFGPAGFALLLFLVLGFIPWYQGWKRLRRARAWVADGVDADVAGLRFETWLLHQRAPVTRWLLLVIAAVGIVQWLAPGGLEESVRRAGLLKAGGRPLETWRIFTAALMHGHVIHFLFNAMALAYLGRRMELLARWPHVVLVFLLSAWVGGEASARFVAAPSLGASGGLLGMLGFLLVFEWTHRRLVPESSRRRLVAGLVMTAAIGVIGFRFIDNAAHAGGLLAGMGYAWAVFPRSASVHRPQETRVDRIGGVIALAGIAVAALWAALKLTGG